MEDIILNAYERQKIRKFKEKGFIPGVIYGDSMKETTPVKFQFQALQKLLNRYGDHAKIWVMINGEKKFGFIKDVQKHPVSHNLQHIDVQAVSKDHEVKIQVPIVFHGEEALNSKLLQLQVQKNIVDIMGKVGDIPDNIVIDVSEMDASDAVTEEHLSLNENIKLIHEGEIYATIAHPKLKMEESETAEEEAETTQEPKAVEERKDEE